MTIFTLQSVKKDFGIKEILKDGSFSLDAADKVGLIGMNGSGKSTLLKIFNSLSVFGFKRLFLVFQNQYISVETFIMNILYNRHR